MWYVNMFCFFSAKKLFTYGHLFHSNQPNLASTSNAFLSQKGAVQQQLWCHWSCSKTQIGGCLLFFLSQAVSSHPLAAHDVEAKCVGTASNRLKIWSFEILKLQFDDHRAFRRLEPFRGCTIDFTAVCPGLFWIPVQRSFSTIIEEWLDQLYLLMDKIMVICWNFALLFGFPFFSSWMFGCFMFCFGFRLTLYQKYSYVGSFELCQLSFFSRCDTVECLGVVLQNSSHKTLQHIKYGRFFLEFWFGFELWQRCVLFGRCCVGLLIWSSCCEVEANK